MLNETIEFLKAEQGDGVWYVASPYSAWADDAGLQAAADEVGRTCDWLVDHGVRVFSPIAHSHAICRAGGSDPLDHKRWLDQDRAIARFAVGLIVVEMDGWESSVGVTKERGWFEEWGRPIVHIPPVDSPRKESTFRDSETILDEAARQVQYATGAVRSADVENTRYDLISPIGLRRVAETCAEGARKYSDYNWERGMPIRDLLNHAISHIYRYLAGDRSEDHLAHGAWNLLGACHSEEQWPALNQGTLRGPGCRPPTADNASRSA